MFDWWKAKDEIKNELRREILNELRSDKEAKEEKQRKKEEERSKEDPHVEIKGMVHDPKKGIRIELDWNDAFIKHLRDNGFDGPDDDAVVQKYIAILAKQVAEDMKGTGEYE